MADNDLDDMLAGIQSEVSAEPVRRVVPKPSPSSGEGEVQQPSERSLRRKAENLVQGTQSRKDKITSLSFTPEFHWELKKFAFERRTTMVAVIEAAVREYMAKN
ncbi:hypothetical protein [Sinorhizobium fredii]|uniref:hypothetical protein n=1 Tax=Rhizobium fredii TaxID=380 RepID=UPI003517ECEB